MDERFREIVEALDPLYQELLTMEPEKAPHFPKTMPRSGIYIFSEGDQHLYVGRSNQLRQRLQAHGQPSSMHLTATFAFILACEEAEGLGISFPPETSRSEREKHPDFAPVYTQMKQRVRDMDVRYVEEADQVRQALLEIYVATALGTEYNSFETH